MMKNTATLTSVTTRSNAECTGLRANTTPSAPASASAENTKKRKTVTRRAPV